MKRFYITTPIYYVNDKPHIGHAYTSLACDVLARFYKLSGQKTYLLTGTDEHGQKIEQAARRAGIDPQEFTDKYSLEFKTLTEKLNINYDDFIRTTDARHKQGAAAFWQRLHDRGAITLGKYQGWYAVRDEAFYRDEQIDIRDGVRVATATGAPVEWVEEDSYFFSLSGWQDKLLQFYEDNPDFIAPETRRNEVISFVKSGLKDLSISRTSFRWGVPIPGDEAHIMYVWVDALTNYITALGFPDEQGLYTECWPADVHMVGKDIVIFHAVYWPALLMAAGLEPPERVFAHGWWTNEGKKISKSLGNVIDPLALIETYGLDQTRYFLMREIGFGQDGDFSHEAMIRRSNSDLANDFGNLCQRSLSMLHKHCNGELSAFDTAPESRELLDKAYGLQANMTEHINRQAFHLALQALFALISDGNRYIDAMQPWTLRKTDPAKMQAVLSTIAELLRICAILAQPFFPSGAGKILDMLNIAGEARQFSAIETHRLPPGHCINAPEIIFPRLEA